MDQIGVTPWIVIGVLALVVLYFVVRAMVNAFHNGNRRIAKLILWKLAWAAVVLFLTQVLGYLPSLDFLSEKALKITSFSLATVLTFSKSVEMFFDQTIQLFRNHEIPIDEPPTEKQET